MKLATVSVNSRTIGVAVLTDGSYLDFAAAAGAHGLTDEALLSGSLQSVIEGGASSLENLSVLVEKAETGVIADHVFAPGAAELLAPIPAPAKNVFCVGRNYAEHIAEGERAQNVRIGITDHPVFFTKPRTAVVHPFGNVLIFPNVSEAVDYEVELAIVIGKTGRNIASADAYDHIFGYTILNDISARDVQRRHGGQYFKGKALDGSCPLGPWIVTADAIADPHDLSIGLTVNGEQRQDGHTQDMIFDIPTLIASLSQGMTLEPGDIIATGTPSGVGYAMEPPQFLKDGDTVECKISGIGTLSNTVRAV